MVVEQDGNTVTDQNIKTICTKFHINEHWLRVGGWRIVFSIPDTNTILIEKIAPRGDVYKGG